MESKFTGRLIGLIGVSLLATLITVCTLSIATPWAICIIVRWYIKHMNIDGKQLSFDGKGGQLFGNWIKWWLLTVITCGIYGWWMPIRVMKWLTKHIHVAEQQQAQAQA